MAITVTLANPLTDGETLTPAKLHNLIDGATLAGFTRGDFDQSSLFLGYGSSRPSVSNTGQLFYDTTPGLEGAYFGFASASNCSVCGWLCAMPRRECYVFCGTAASAGTPLFLGSGPGFSTGEFFTCYDGSFFPKAEPFTGASGPDAVMFLTLESSAGSGPVKCMWAGLVPDTLNLNLLNGAASAASVGASLFVDYAEPAQFKFGSPTSRNFIFGVNTLNNSTGAGALIWGAGPVIEDIA